MIYLDHAATTPLDGRALGAMTPFLTETFGNPSSQHGYGRAAANAVVAARDKISSLMGVPSDDLYFTSGGTEAANLAVKGICFANADRGKHLVISAIEHPALIESALDLRAFGFETTFVRPDKNGVIPPQAVEEALRPDTVFAAVMSANNETGVIQPIQEIYRACKRRGIFFYCDCVQTAGVLPFSLFPADGVGISAHKFYGPKGFGAVYIRADARFRRLLSGGRQERGMRGGTTYVAGAVGCAEALKIACDGAEENNRRVAQLRDLFVRRVCSEIEGVYVNGGTENRLPSNANLSFEGCGGENLLFVLDLHGVAVSTGSACSSGAAKPSHVLTAMGLDEWRVKSAVRFTFGRNNTEEETAAAVEILKQAVQSVKNNA